MNREHATTGVLDRPRQRPRIPVLYLNKTGSGKKVEHATTGVHTDSGETPGENDTSSEEKGPKTPIRRKIRVSPENKLTYVDPFETAPQGPLDALLVIGTHPIEPVLDGPPGNRKPVMTHPMMRNGRDAAWELLRRGYVKQDGVVILSGNESGYPKIVETARHMRDAIFSTQKGPRPAITYKIFRFPASEQEEELLNRTTEADLLEDALNTQGGAILDAQGITRIKNRNATELVYNFIHMLNTLDGDVDGEPSDAIVGAVAPRNQAMRTERVADLLGIAHQIVPLASQEVLKHFGKEPVEIEDDTVWSDKALWREQKWVRALDLPEHALPMLGTITNNKRLIQVLEHLRDNVYGEEVMNSFGLTTLTLANIHGLRVILKHIERKDPLEEDWMKEAEEIEKITEARERHIKFTPAWLGDKRNLAKKSCRRVITSLFQTSQRFLWVGS